MSNICCVLSFQSACLSKKKFQLLHSTKSIEFFSFILQFVEIIWWIKWRKMNLRLNFVFSNFYDSVLMLFIVNKKIFQKLCFYFSVTVAWSDFPSFFFLKKLKCHLALLCHWSQSSLHLSWVKNNLLNDFNCLYYF